jgi:hypothetical protein
MEEIYEIGETVICPDGRYAQVLASNSLTTKVRIFELVQKDYPTKILIRVSDR